MMITGIAESISNVLYSEYGCNLTEYMTKRTF